MSANSHEQVVALAQGRIIFEGTYHFHTPNSINAPQGTFTLTITEADKLEASGTMKITTLWEDTTHTSLTYHAQAGFSGSTGITLINGTGKGTITYDFNKKRPITAGIGMKLEPGMRTGELTVQGFGEAMPCQAVQISIDDLPR